MWFQCVTLHSGFAWLACVNLLALVGFLGLLSLLASLACVAVLGGLCLLGFAQAGRNLNVIWKQSQRSLETSWRHGAQEKINRRSETNLCRQTNPFEKMIGLVFV